MKNWEEHFEQKVDESDIELFLTKADLSQLVLYDSIIERFESMNLVPSSLKTWDGNICYKSVRHVELEMPIYIQLVLFL